VSTQAKACPGPGRQFRPQHVLHVPRTQAPASQELGLRRVRPPFQAGCRPRRPPACCAAGRQRSLSAEIESVCADALLSTLLEWGWPVLAEE